ncbi:MAG TPA: FliH/SctL family protein, partial [Lachnospiraceae bacterium]|nr:FliH/SctL family protein [Lachnospiraceae bacterium]
MSRNLFKSSHVVVKSENKRVIDSNSLIAERIQTLSALLKEEELPGDFPEEFSEGLDADQVERLLGDPAEQEADFREHEKSAEKLIQNAKEEAERILEAAREDADGILKAAKAEAKSLKAEAIQAGHGEGYQAGYDEGLQGVEKMKAACVKEQKQLEDSYEKRVNELEPQFVETLTGIYEHIFHLDLSDKKETVLYLLKDAIRNIESGKNFFAHVSKGDYEFVSGRKEELLTGLGSAGTVEVIEDLTLQQGQCFIETEGGIFDCGIGTELELLKKELKLLSY